MKHGPGAIKPDNYTIERLYSTSSIYLLRGSLCTGQNGGGLLITYTTDHACRIWGRDEISIIITNNNKH